jgi:hypothetical protein
MAAFVKYNSGAEALVEGINAGSDTWKIALTNTTPNVSTNTVLANITDLPTSGGYTAGGNTCAVTSSAQTGGVYKLVLASPAMWTASGAGFTFRYAVLYDVTASNSLVGYWDYGLPVVMNGTNGDTFTITLDAVNGVFWVT